MGDLSEHFNRANFTCKCGCGFNDINIILIEYLELIRLRFGQRLFINCGCRCKKHNREVGGATNSQHLIGNAADIVIEDVKPDMVADYADMVINQKGGVGRYDSFTHVDLRGTKARWDDRTPHKP